MNIVEAERISPAPFRAWCERRAEQLGTWSDVAVQLGVDATQLRRWCFEQEVVNRRLVEAALERADVAYWELYGVEDIDLEADAYCECCKDTVTPIEGVCPWCESQVARARARMWCAREDRLVFPADDGSCWRCGSALEPIPWRECACGCGREIPAFDPQGRRHEFAHGHAPRTRESDREIDVEPFRSYLEGQLRTIDLVGAVARAHGISRDDVANVLAGRAQTIRKEVVRRALWTAARTGTGKGLPMRPGALQFRDLYPDEVRKTTCLGCGGGKAPQAELCKGCRRKANRQNGVRPPRSCTWLRPELVDEAWQLYEAGASSRKAAEAIFGRTPHTSVESLASALRRAWRASGRELRKAGQP